MQETEGRVYQQVEIDSGPVPPHRRAAGRRRRRARQGHLRGRRPADRAAAARPGRDLAPGADRARSSAMAESEGNGRGGALRARGRRGDPRGRRVAAIPKGAIRSEEPLPQALPVLPLREMVTFPDTLTPLAVGQERSIKLVDDVLAGNRMLAMVASTRPRERGARPRGPLRGRRRRRRRADAQGPRRDDPHPRPGHPAGPDRRLRPDRALPGRQGQRAARRGRAEPRAAGADPQRRRPPSRRSSSRSPTCPRSCRWRSPTSTTPRRSAT